MRDLLAELRARLTSEHIVVSERGSQTRLYVLDLREHGVQNIVAMLGQIRLSYDAKCGAYSVDHSAALKGYGPLLYDAAMEWAYPKGLVADTAAGTSSKATRVWAKYLERSDVTHKPKPGKCKKRGVEALDSIFFKRPKLRILPAKTFARMAAKHVGGDFGDPETSSWDFTPKVTGAWESRTSLIEMTANGDCYEAAGNYMMRFIFGDAKDDSRIHRLRLVHGEVTGQGPLEGIKYGHAWVEDGNMVIDQSNGKDLRMPKAAYYALGRIGSNVHKYTMAEFKRKAVETGIWGPWDLETESGY
jgi:GNAT superfamily N-acetyltransferase